MYNLVILLDCTDSMKTTESKVIASIAFETVCKFMEGMACPFTVNHSFTSESTRIVPDIFVSVIGMGTKGKINTFLYNQHVERSNIMNLAEIIYKSIIKFENESINYEKTKLENSIDSLANHNQSFLIHDLQPSESDISMLDLGISYLDLMNREEALPVMVLITDGVSLDLFLSSEEANRKIIRDLINVCIVQTGSGGGYSCTSNLGHIPNNEYLRFLSLRTDGVFIYAEDCPYISEEVEVDEPNLYHRWVGFKKFTFSETNDQYLIGAKRRPVDEIRSRFINTAVAVSHSEDMHEEISFPWLPDSKSPYIAEILCSYRNYKLLNISIDALLKLRTNEGFVLSKINRSESQTKKMHKLEMIFILHLALHVKIIYSIKFTISNPKTTNLIGYVPPKGIRVEMNVLAHHSFAILFINVHNLDASKSDTISSGLYTKLVNLHSTLKSISEADETLHILYQFNTPSALYLANQMNSGFQYEPPSFMELPSNYWNFLNQAILVKPWLLDTMKIVILLLSTSTQSNMGARALASLQAATINLESPRNRYQVSTIYLSRLLTSWASISLSKTSHLAWVFENSLDSTIPTGFCLLQVIWETESLMSLNMRFFSVSIKERNRISYEFEKEVSSLRHINRNNPLMPIRPLYVCRKPLDSILIYYSSLDEASKNEEGYLVSDYFLANKTPARSFLRHKRWIWFRDLNHKNLPEGFFSSMLESAFILLYNTRVAEGYSRAAESSGIVTFYKEIESSEFLYTFQYLILYDKSSGYIATELWLEPFVNTDTDEEKIFYDASFILQFHNPAFIFRNLQDCSKELVSSVFHLPSIISRSSIHLLQFLSSDIDVIEDSETELVVPFDSFNISSHFLETGNSSEIILDDLKCPLLSFFHRCLSDAAVCEYHIPFSKKPDLKIINQNLSFGSSRYYCFPIDENTLIVFCLPYEIEPGSTKIFGSLFEFIQPNLSDPGKLQIEKELVLIKPSEVSHGDGSIVFEERENRFEFRNNETGDIIFTPSRTTNLKKNTDENNHRMSLSIDIIVNCFNQGLARYVYSLAIKGQSISSFDLGRSLKGLKPSIYSIDISNYLYLYSKLKILDQTINFENEIYQEIIFHDFSDIKSLMDGVSELDNLIFYRKETPSANFPASADPLFISLCIKLSNGRMIKCCDSLLIDGDIFTDHVEDLEVPLDTSQKKDELIFEIFTIDGSDSFSSDKVQAIMNLKKHLSILIDDTVIKILLDLAEEDFPLSTVSYIEGLLFERLSETSIPNCIDDAIAVNQNLTCLRLNLMLISPECATFLKEDLPTFECLGSPIRQCHEFYYSFQKKTNPFWITITLFDNEVEIHLYCEARDLALRRSILESIQNSISECTQVANQKFLLRELVETHYARENIDTKFACFQSSKIDDILGPLACDECMVRYFPINWRLRPSYAFNSIMASLQALAIANRRNCLVFSEDFYMVLEYFPAEDKNVSKSDIFDTPVRKENGEVSKVWGITLKVFGIKEPCVGKSDILRILTHQLEITNDFCKMIESKIDLLIQQSLAGFIARNPVAKLNRSDYAFLMPGQANYNSTYLLVKELENPHLFLVLLRQAFLLFLHPSIGNEICSVLTGYYSRVYGKDIPEEKDPSLQNVLNLGNLSFIYNCISRRQLSQLESKVGFGTACISLTPFNMGNEILFPSHAESVLGSKYAVELDNNKFQVKECQDEDIIRKWPGYKVSVSVWIKGAIHFEPLKERIEMAFKYTLVDYAIESYYRSSKWYSIGGRKRLPDPPADDNSALLIDLSNEYSHPNNVLSALPEVLQTGARRLNPVLQSISISSSLPLDTIALGFRSVLVDEDLQALFFVKRANSQTNEFSLLDRMLKPKSDISLHDYVIIGAADILRNPADNRKQSNASETAGFRGSPRCSEMNLKKESLDFIAESEGEGLKDRITQKSDDYEEVFMFPDLFYPPFPVYGKRSSFFVVSLSGNLIHVSTYNWKKSESDKFFLKVIKILLVSRFNNQFMIRKEWYSEYHASKCSAVVSDIREKLHSSSGKGMLPRLGFNATFATIFRELDFIYHIRGYDATNLQTQLVDYLETFFRQGSQKSKSSENIGNTPLSLQEMSKVLQSITLIHSSSSPIFFSDCCTDLLVKWQQLIETQSVNSEDLLGLGKSIVKSSPSLKKGDYNSEELWFKSMIEFFIQSYTAYLESMGMKKSNINIKSTDCSQYGGALAINSKVLIHSSSVFMENVFPSGIILVQIGFYEYFVSVNVLSFDYGSSNEATLSNSTNDFEQECEKMKDLIHIVSFLYDFHLRFIQRKLMSCSNHEVDIVKILRNFVSLNPRKARFARNRIIHGYHEWNQESSDLFRYIVKNPSHGFQPICFQEKSLAISLTTDHISQRKEKSPTTQLSNYKYTLILCEEPEGEPKRLEYFILIIDSLHDFPRDYLDEGPEITSHLDINPLKEYLEGGYYLSDVLKAFEKMIETLIEKGLKDFGRDNLWVQLRDEPIQNSAEWTSLFLEKINPLMRDITHSEHSVQFLISSRLPWDDIFQYLAILFKKKVRILNNSADPLKKHLIVFNPKNPAFFLYFRLSAAINSDDCSLSIFGVSREGIRDPVEYQHLSEVVDAILHYLWQLSLL